MAVELYTAPWVSGTRAQVYYGPIAALIFIEGDDEDEWYDAQYELLSQLEQKAEEMGANAVVGVSISLNPFAEHDGKKGLGLHAEGTAAKLERFHW